MTDLHPLPQQLLDRAATRPVGSASMFALKAAAEALHRAIDAEARETAAQPKEAVT